MISVTVGKPVELSARSARSKLLPWVFRVEAQSGESLGHFLGRFRRANYLSHKALAEHLGVRVEWVQAWETPSRRRNPSQLQLVALSKLVEVEVKQLSSMLPPEHLHLQTRLCATCYGEVPIHQVVWQRAERTNCARHGERVTEGVPRVQNWVSDSGVVVRRTL